ncbi:GrpB family protein [Lactiplantibacillus modestisalitolerans]|uniref:GrpB family protein n=1 Tax=Lactiplantibacillus modestisalitolerans TaxID=1457219 RepID=A0ABV5WSG9_9LACO|nr:GrpB family protein [Lactiplantibacillus modestisalitolerans]
MQTIQLTTYQPAWQALATHLQAQLADQLGSQLIDSSHVGSTAMPQLLARPIIDIALLVREPQAVINQLHVKSVAGQPNTFSAHFQGQLVHYLITPDEASYQQLLAVRDYFNAHRTDGRKYTALRQTAADNAATYAQTKGQFLAGISDKANDWLANKAQHEHHDRTVRAELVNMCLITNPQTGEVLVENKVDAQWQGLTFPGGHVAPGESQVAAIKREVREETGLTVHQLKLVGTVTWVENAAGDVSLGTLYTTNNYDGDLLAGSYEGAISWQPLSALTPDKLAPGVAAMLQVFTDENANEAFWGSNDTQLRVY